MDCHICPKSFLKSIDFESKALKHEFAILEAVCKMKRLQSALQLRIFKMNSLITNPGLQHLAIRIFAKLNIQDLKHCRIVCKLWKDMIENDKSWLHYNLNKVKNKPHIIMKDDLLNYFNFKIPLIEEFPEWQKVHDYFECTKNIQDLKSYVNFMKDYFENESNTWTPLHFACLNGNIEMVKLFVKSPINIQILDKSGKTALDLATDNAHLEIVQLLNEIKGI